MSKSADKLFQWIYLPLVIPAVVLVVVFIVNVAAPWGMDIDNRFLQVTALFVATAGSLAVAFYGTAWAAWTIAELLSSRK